MWSVLYNIQIFSNQYFNFLQTEYNKIKLHSTHVIAIIAVVYIVYKIYAPHTYRICVNFEEYV